MPRPVTVRLSTTSTIVGHELVRHVGPITAQFVIGTGLFTDVFSSFTDFFGAGSKSYQKKLSKVERQGLYMIRARAAQVGANAVIGLRIDHDEISGGGKSMLMVTLSGTGVIARRTQSDDAEQHEGALGPDLLEDEVAVRSFIQEYSDHSRGFPDKAWDFVIEHPRLDLAPLVLQRVASLFEVALHAGPEYRVDERANEASAFFAGLPAPLATDFLYGRLGHDEYHGEGAAVLLVRAQLADLDRHLDALKSDDPLRCSNAIRSVTAHPPLYHPQDSQTLRAMADQLRTGFPVTAAENEKKGLLSSATWTCGSCGTENPKNEQRCQECDLDERGLDAVSVDFDALADTLESRAAALEARFAE